ncbi:hypothetical protein MRX96_038146, partial [Rhipicephalus microplus]
MTKVTARTAYLLPRRIVAYASGATRRAICPSLCRPRTSLSPLYTALFVDLTQPGSGDSCELVEAHQQARRAVRLVHTPGQVPERSSFSAGNPEAGGAGSFSTRLACQRTRRLIQFAPLLREPLARTCAVRETRRGPSQMASAQGYATATIYAPCSRAPSGGTPRTRSPRGVSCITC